MGKNIYRPSWKNTAKYSIYINYFWQYIRYGDFKSLWASLRYVLTHKLPTRSFFATSEMGKYHIRQNSTDFQFINHAYEKSIKDYLKNNIDEFDVFIDAGACIGEYGIWLARMGKRTMAIEPVNFAALQQNATLNHVEDKMKLVECGLGSKKEQVYFEKVSGVTSSSYANRKADGEPNANIERLDDLYPEWNLKKEDRIILKLDVEGMECEAIAGATSFFKEFPFIKVIFEHFREDEYRIDKALLALAPFTFRDIDTVNRLAEKKTNI